MLVKQPKITLELDASKCIQAEINLLDLFFANGAHARQLLELKEFYLQIRNKYAVYNSAYQQANVFNT